jgi:hypothetical protein
VEDDQVAEFAGGSQPGDYAQDPDTPRHDPPWQESDDADDASKAQAGVKFSDGTKIQGYWDGGTGGDGTVYPDGKTDGGVQGGVTITIPFGGPSSGSSHGDATQHDSGDSGDYGDTTYEPETPGVHYHPTGNCFSDSGDEYRSGETATFGDGKCYLCSEGTWLPLSDPDEQPGDYPDQSDDGSGDSYAATDDSDDSSDA